LLNRDISSKIIIAKMLNDYFKNLYERNVIESIKIALELSQSKVLVWAQIPKDDEKTEDSLILSEAAVNAIYSSFGFNIYSTIVEDCDELSVPPHYKEVHIKA